MIVNISHKSAAKLHKTIEMPAPFREYFSKKDGVAMEEDSRIEFSIRIASHHPQCDVGLPSAFSVCYVWKIRGLFCTFAEPQALVSAVSEF